MAEEIAPSIRSFEVFLAVQRTGSFSLAGKQLGMPQPTVTQRVQSLERVIGARLFDRRVGEVRLTPAGATLMAYAERIVAARDELVQALNGKAGVATGTLRVAASSTPGNYILPVILQRFHEANSGVRVLMSISDSRDVIEKLFDGKAELGIVGGTPADHQLVCEPFLEDEIVAIARPGDPLLSPHPLETPELVRHAWIVREPGSATRAAVETMLQRNPRGAGLNIAMQFDSTEAIKLAVRAGAGVALVSRRGVESEVAAGLLAVRRVGKAGLHRPISAVRLQGRTISAPAQQLWDRLVGAGSRTKAVAL